MTETTEQQVWIPCRRCKGTGTFEWSPGKSGPCFLCNGTGDGRIKNFQGFGPRRGGKYQNQHKGNGQDHGQAIPAESVPVPAVPAPSVPAILPGHLSAAEHLAAALAGLAGAAPIDHETVRGIIRDEFANEGNALVDLLAQTDRRIAEIAAKVEQELADALAGVPRKLIVEWNGQQHELPAVRHHTFEKLFKLVRAGKRVYLVGPAGSGKTTAARQIADALGLTFYYQGAMSGSHMVLGHEGLTRYHTTPTREAWEKGGLLLIDEIDGSEADAALAIHPMDNGHMTFPDCPTPIARHPDFRLIVAANTYGKGADRIYVGRTQLDGATLNRFITLEWNYDEKLERAIAGDTEWTKFVQSARKAMDKLKIRHVLSPRNSIDANDLHGLGFERDEVEAMAIWQGMPDADIARVRSAMA